MNRIATIALVALATLASTANRASAQAQIIAESNVSFSFHVNGVTLPAGHYVVVSHSPNLLEVRNTNRPSAAAFVLANDSDKAKLDSRNKMVSEQYGNQYFLHEVSYPAAGMDLVVAPSSEEKRVAVELAKANGKPVLVALK